MWARWNVVLKNGCVKRLSIDLLVDVFCVLRSYSTAFMALYEEAMLREQCGPVDLCLLCAVTWNGVL
jgi:hypothetical protein